MRALDQETAERRVALAVRLLHCARRIGVTEVPELEGLVVEVDEIRCGGELEVVVEIAVPHRCVDPAHGRHGGVVHPAVGRDDGRDACVDAGHAPVIGAQRQPPVVQKLKQEGRMPQPVGGLHVQSPAVKFACGQAEIAAQRLHRRRVRLREGF